MPGFRSRISYMEYTSRTCEGCLMCVFEMYRKAMISLDDFRADEYYYWIFDLANVFNLPNYLESLVNYSFTILLKNDSED